VSDVQDPEPPRCSLLRTPSSPSPAHGASDVSTTVTLTWSTDPAAERFDVYLGIDATPDAGELVEEVRASRWTAGGLESGTTYFWRVAPVNECDEAVLGPTWHFTTRTVEVSDGTSTQEVPTVRRTASPCGAFGILGLVFMVASCVFLKLVRIRRYKRQA